MKFFLNLILLLLLVSSGCGKKASLERYPNSDYPKQYPNKK
jgi:predicted small lipoprotein YifL